MNMLARAVVPCVLSLVCACMGTPENGRVLPSTNSVVQFSGFDVTSETDVELQVGSSPTGPFVTFASTKTDDSPWTFADGTRLYSWSMRGVIPTWQPACGGQEAFVRARAAAGYNLLTYDHASIAGSSALECVTQELTQPGVNILQALAACSSPESPVVRLTAPGVGLPTVHVGDVTIASQAEADEYACIEEIQGSLTIGESDALSIALPSLERVTGDLHLTFVRDAGPDPFPAAIRAIDLSALTEVGGSISAVYLGTHNDVVSLDIGLEALTSVGADVHIELTNVFNGDLAGFDSVTSLPADLTVLGGSDDAAWHGLFPNLANVAASVYTRTGHSTYGVLRELTSVGGSLRVEGFLVQPAPLQQSFSQLVSVAGDVELVDLGLNLGGMPDAHALPVLSSVAGVLRIEASSLLDLAVGSPAGLDVGALSIAGNAAMTTMHGDHLTVLGAGPVEILDNPNLSSCDAEAFVAQQVLSGWAGTANIANNGGC